MQSPANTPVTTLPEPSGNPAIIDPPENLDPIDSPEDAVELDFGNLDADGDREITAEEANQSGVLLEAQFNKIDTNRDGVIDQFEMEDYQDRKEEALD